MRKDTFELLALGRRPAAHPDYSKPPATNPVRGRWTAHVPADLHFQTLTSFEFRSHINKWYLAIWYKISKLTPVWIANRVVPISDPKLSELSISKGTSIIVISMEISWMNSIITFSRSEPLDLARTDKINRYGVHEQCSATVFVNSINKQRLLHCFDLDRCFFYPMDVTQYHATVCM